MVRASLTVSVCTCLIVACGAEPSGAPGSTEDDANGTTGSSEGAGESATTGPGSTTGTGAASTGAASTGAASTGAASTAASGPGDTTSETEAVAETGHDASSEGGDTSDSPCWEPGFIVFTCEAPSPRGLAFGEDRLYWADYNTNEIYAAPRGGGEPELVPKPNDVGADDAPLHIAVDGTNVYWTEPQTGRVRMVREDGATFSIATGDNPTFIALNGSDAWWTDTVEFGNVYRNQTPFGPVSGQQWGYPDVVLADDQFFYVPGGRVRYYEDGTQDAVESFGVPGMSEAGGRFAVSGPDAYWAGYLDGGLYLVSGPVDGSVEPTLLTELTYTAQGRSGIAVDSTDIYFVDYGADAIRRIAKSGEADTLETIAEGQARPFDILVDAERVYWSTRGADGMNYSGSVVAALK